MIPDSFFRDLTMQPKYSEVLKNSTVVAFTRWLGTRVNSGFFPLSHISQTSLLNYSSSYKTHQIHGDFFNQAKLNEKIEISFWQFLHTWAYHNLQQDHSCSFNWGAIYHMK